MVTRPLVWHLSLVLLALMLALSNTVLGQSVGVTTIRGTVVSVADGDTLTVLDGDHIRHKIGLLGVDAPEKMQAFGRKSKFSLSDLTLLKQVEVKTGQYVQDGRTLGVVLVQGEDVNLSQLQRGMAWMDPEERKSPSAQDRNAYKEAQAVAKVRRLGLWGLNKPVPPWEFKQGKTQHR